MRNTVLTSRRAGRPRPHAGPRMLSKRTDSDADEYDAASTEEYTESLSANGINQIPLSRRWGDFFFCFLTYFPASWGHLLPLQDAPERR